VLVSTNPEKDDETTLLELSALRHLAAAARIAMPASRFKFKDSNVKLLPPTDDDDRVTHITHASSSSSPSESEHTRTDGIKKYPDPVMNFI
jgi:hypothetical protein